MSPPCYADLGKSARDLFNKGYIVGQFKIDATTKAGPSKEVEFKTLATHGFANGGFLGNLDIKYSLPQYGLTLTEKWNTENLLGTVVEIKDQIAKGLKVTLDSSYAATVGKRTGKLKTEYCAANVLLNCDIGLDAGPLISFAGVVGRDGWLMGLQTGFDVASSKMKSTNVAFGRVANDHTLHAYVNNGSEFGASFYHKVTDTLEMGALLGWMLGDQGARFALAAKYCPSRDIELRAKINNHSRVAFSTTHVLSDQLKLILSSEFGLSSMNEGGKLGCGLEYKA